MTPYENLSALGLVLPEPFTRPSNWCLEPFVLEDNFLFLSGHGPNIGNKPKYTGRLGEDFSIKEGKKAAQLCILNLLRTTETAIGDLNKVEKVVKLFGMVKCSRDFNKQPEVINGASSLLVRLFGDRGKHARTAVGMYDLPRGISVEIEMILKVKT